MKRGRNVFRKGGKKDGRGGGQEEGRTEGDMTKGKQHRMKERTKEQRKEEATPNQKPSIFHVWNCVNHFLYICFWLCWPPRFRKLVDNTLCEAIESKIKG